MALLRLMVTAGIAAATCACNQAGAQPSAASGLMAPAGWEALPEIATAVATAAKADGVTVEGAEAWGDTARGCYGVWLAMRGDTASAQQVLAGITAQPLTTTTIVKPEGADGLLTLSFETMPPAAATPAAPIAAGSAAATPSVQGTYRGRLRARVAAGRVTALACFANDREPASCETPCTALLGGLP